MVILRIDASALATVTWSRVFFVAHDPHAEERYPCTTSLTFLPGRNSIASTTRRSNLGTVGRSRRSGRCCAALLLAETMVPVSLLSFVPLPRVSIPLPTAGACLVPEARQHLQQLTNKTTKAISLPWLQDGQACSDTGFVQSSSGTYTQQRSPSSPLVADGSVFSHRSICWRRLRRWPEKKETAEASDALDVAGQNGE